MPPKRKTASKKKAPKVVEEDSTAPAEESPVLPQQEIVVDEPAPEQTLTQPDEGQSSNALDTDGPGPQKTRAMSDPMAMEVDAQSGSPAPGPSLTMEERQAKLDQLRAKMRSSLQANRKDLVEDSAKQKTTFRDQVRLEKQRKLAEALREKVDASEKGEDTERKRNWDYSIEENDVWEKALARKKRRSNMQFNDFEDASRRRYKKDIDALKPDLKAYEELKAAALGSSSTAVAAREDLYRDANTLQYADHKPSEDALDRLAKKLNEDTDRKRNFSKPKADKEGDITYINEANKVFNKKIERYYNKYTAEIRANFERGTAL